MIKKNDIHRLRRILGDTICHAWHVGGYPLPATTDLSRWDERGQYNGQIISDRNGWNGETIPFRSIAYNQAERDIAMLRRVIAVLEPTVPKIEHPDFYVSKNVREHNLQMLQEVAELTKLYSEGKYFQFLEGTKDLTPEQLVEVAPLLKPAIQKLRKQDDPDFHRKQDHPPECKWHKDWHACDCGYFDKSDKHHEEDWKCPTCGDPDFNCHHDEDENDSQ